jgi:hypothetical protein
MLNNDQNVQASVATKDDSSNGARYIKTNCYKTNRNLHISASKPSHRQALRLFFDPV